MHKSSTTFISHCLCKYLTVKSEALPCKGSYTHQIKFNRSS